jgi:hypothetical protein
LLLLSSSSLALASCVTVVPNTTQCTVAGSFEAGAICAETNTGIISEMTPDEFIAFLLPSDGYLTGKPRAGAVCQSAADYNAMKTALEQACRILGKRCRFQRAKWLNSID